MKCSGDEKRKTVSPCSSGQTNGRRGKSHRRSFTFHAALSNFRSAQHRLSPVMVCLLPNSQQLPQLFAWFPSEKASTRQSQRNGRRTERDAEVLGNISIIILVLTHDCSPNLRLREMKYSTSEGGACVEGDVKKTNSDILEERRNSHSNSNSNSTIEQCILMSFQLKGVISRSLPPASDDRLSLVQHVKKTCHQKSIKSPRYQLFSFNCWYICDTLHYANMSTDQEAEGGE